jgi:hypothetical protein
MPDLIAATMPTRAAGESALISPRFEGKDFWSGPQNDFGMPK